jgi:hypothetical protein
MIEFYDWFPSDEEHVPTEVKKKMFAKPLHEPSIAGISELVYQYINDELKFEDTFV